ncbi:MAG: phage baseplate assembly protein V [Thermodesulfobacteriota bacterium]
MREDLAFRVAELERRVGCLLRLGTVAELDAGAARVRVRSGELLTAWLPWLTRRAGPDRDWWAPEPGEQVLLLAPSGELAAAVVLPAVYQQAHPAPASAATKHRVEYADGGFSEYDRFGGWLRAEAKGPALLTAGGAVGVMAQAEISLAGSGASAVKGVVQGDCICPFIRKPHLHLSADVRASKG